MPNKKSKSAEFIRAKADMMISLFIFLIIFANYILFLAPSVTRWDSAELIVASAVLGIPHPTGYPVYIWIGHLFTLLPLGSVAYRVNLMSAFFGAVTAALLYLLIFNIVKLSKNLSMPLLYVRAISIVSALLFAFSRAFWAGNEFTEVYSLNTFFICLVLLLLIKWYEKDNIKFLYCFSFIYGLSFGAHASNILFAPAFLFFIIFKDYKVLLKPKKLLILGVLFFIGLSQFFYIYFRALQNPPFNYAGGPLSWGGWGCLITGFCQFKSQMFAFSFSGILDRTALYFSFLRTNFTFFGIALALFGIVCLIKRAYKVGVLLILMLLGNFWFFVQYITGELYFMFIPSYLILAIFIGYGAWEIVLFIKNQPKSHLRSILLALLFVFLFVFILNLYVTNFKSVGKSHELAASNYGYSVLKNVPENSIIITDWEYSNTFIYFKIVEKINSSVEIGNYVKEEWLNQVRRNIDKKQVFLTSPLPEVLEEYDLVSYLGIEGGRLYKVEKKL